MIEVIKCENIDSDIEWLEFLRNQYNIFFDSKFLSYNDKFEKNINWHHLKFKDNETNKILAIIIGCEKEIHDKKVYLSSDGVSFGGFLWKKRGDVIEYLKIIDSYKTYLKKNNFQKAVLRCFPFLYNQIPNEENEYALIHEGFHISFYAITNIIDLDEFEFKNISDSKKRSINKSKAKIKINLIENIENNESYSEYYNVLLNDRDLKDVVPTHNKEELLFLKNQFPEQIKFFSAEIDGKITGICILFCINPRVILNFYLAQDEKYKEYGVAEYILYESIQWAKNNGFRYYDIGTSNIGDKLSEGLFAFKKRFLANGYLRKTFEINL
jgi:hypothetical protein